MDRKTFIQKTAGAMLLVVPAYAILNCSSSDDSDSDNNSGGNGNPTPDCLANGATASSISSNHGHSLIVSSADVLAEADKIYSIQGSSGHAHEVTVTSANFNTLQSNQQISVTSTNGDGHTHSVTISCA